MLRTTLFAAALVAFAVNFAQADVQWGINPPSANYFDFTISKSVEGVGLHMQINYYDAEGNAVAVLNNETGQDITQYDQEVGLPFSSTLGQRFDLNFAFGSNGLYLSGVLRLADLMGMDIPVEEAMSHTPARTNLLGFLGGSVGALGIFLGEGDASIKDVMVGGTLLGDATQGTWNYITFDPTSSLSLTAALTAGDSTLSMAELEAIFETGDLSSVENWESVTIRFYGEGEYPPETATPEPATLLIFGLGVSGAALARVVRRRRK